MPKRKRGITGDVASRREAIRKRERRVVEIEEERSRRLSTMAQRGQDRRAEETEEQRNSRLSHSISFLESLCVDSLISGKKSFSFLFCIKVFNFVTFVGESK
ncbi:hypothetical protein AVEN_6030-1 [Araneus ventricosus]|uniref:Uncharacterized protein n=1 Tax=Araneus ventricosus TaxID=182803 RepID=A0A4Y2HSW7_ARAVE|nr:hypothetical protein AVEN_6030-1 [Araneus ventricosus]